MDEIIIVGAGPAGATAAIELSRKGHEVLLLERRAPGRPKVCAGGLPPKVIGALPVDVRDLIEASCDGIRFRFRGRAEHLLRFRRPVIHMIDRGRLDARLMRAAARAGAAVRTGVRVRHIEDGPGGVTVHADGGRFRARAVVAADGALGAGARLLGRQGVRLWPARQVEVDRARLPDPLWADTLHCDFGWPVGGIGWVFPKADHLSVGVCAARPGLDLGRALAGLLASLGLDADLAAAARRHPIPSWNGRLRFSRGAVLVAGDAAGLVNPLSGAGIRRACISGRLAAETLAAFLAGGGRHPADLAAYDRRVRAELVDELIRARWLARIFYGAPELFYRLGVLNARINPWVEELLSGQKDYRQVARELLSLSWLRSKRSGQPLRRDV